MAEQEFQGELAEAIAKIEQMAENRVRAQTVQVQRYDDVEDRWIHPNGTQEFQRRPAPPRRHILHALDQVPGFAESCTSPMIWYNEGDVTVVCDNQLGEHHVDRATLTFDDHDDWTAVEELRVRTFSPRELASFLKFKLWNTLDDKGKSFLKAVRRIQFSQQQTSRHTNDVTAKSLGRDVAAHVETETGDLDQYEILVLNVRPSTDRTVGQATIPIMVGFDTDPLLQTLRLQPLAGEIDAAETEFVKRVENYLKQETDAPCLYGRPE